MAIIQAIWRGERDPRPLARRRNERCKRAEAEIARALQGNWRAEHLFALKRAVQLHEFCRVQLRECGAQLRARLATFAGRGQGQPRPPRQQRRALQKRSNGPAFEAGGASYRMAGVDLTASEGIDEATALVILSEIGLDVSRFPSAKHFTSRPGLCPRHQGSAGKIRSRRVHRGANRAGRALRPAVRACHRAKHALGAFYRRIRARAGAAKAIVATARKLAERIYRLLKYGEDYVRHEVEAYEAAYQERLVKGLSRRAAELGSKLGPTTAGVPTWRRAGAAVGEQQAEEPYTE
jgi:transposase